MISGPTRIASRWPLARMRLASQKVTTFLACALDRSKPTALPTTVSKEPSPTCITPICPAVVETSDVWMAMRLSNARLAASVQLPSMKTQRQVSTLWSWHGDEMLKMARLLKALTFPATVSGLLTSMEEMASPSHLSTRRRLHRLAATLFCIKWWSRAPGLLTVPWCASQSCLSKKLLIVAEAKCTSTCQGAYTSTIMWTRCLRQE